MSAGLRGFGHPSSLRVRLNRFVGLAITLTSLAAPDHAQGVEDEGICNRQFARVCNNLIGVVNKRVQSDTPRFVSDDSVAVRACRLRIVAVAVKDSWDVVGHL